MRRRFQDDADARLLLSRFLRAVDEVDLPHHSITLLFYISAQPDGTCWYAEAALGCNLNIGQMDRAVSALREKRLIVSSASSEERKGPGRRPKRLTVTRDGTRVIGHLIASSSDE